MLHSLKHLVEKFGNGRTIMYFRVGAVNKIATKP